MYIKVPCTVLATWQVVNKCHFSPLPFPMKEKNSQSIILKVSIFF